jgi:hypothetical protein
MQKTTLLILSLLCLGFNAKGGEKDTFLASRVIVPHVHYTYQMPLGDMKDRFSDNSSVGVGLFYKSKSNWMVGLEYNALFGTKVIENDIFSNLMGNTGALINTDGQFASVRLFERGFNAFAKVGKIFPFNLNQNSGLMVQFGVGALQHKIKMEFDEFTLPQLAGDNYKGYDRLTNGMAIYNFVGYQHLDKKHRLDFYIGADLTTGFTQNRRSWNWDTQEQDKTKRVDMLFGFKFGLLIPIYRKQLEDNMMFE